MRPQLLLFQQSRGLGGRKATPGCYERVGYIGLDRFGNYHKEQPGIFLDWFKDAEIQTIQIV